MTIGKLLDSTTVKHPALNILELSNIVLKSIKVMNINFLTFLQNYCIVQLIDGGKS